MIQQTIFDYFCPLPLPPIDQFYQNKTLFLIIYLVNLTECAEHFRSIYHENEQEICRYLSALYLLNCSKLINFHLFFSTILKQQLFTFTNPP